MSKVKSFVHLYWFFSQYLELQECNDNETAAAAADPAETANKILVFLMNVIISVMSDEFQGAVEFTLLPDWKAVQEFVKNEKSKKVEVAKEGMPRSDDQHHIEFARKFVAKHIHAKHIQAKRDLVAANHNQAKQPRKKRLSDRQNGAPPVARKRTKRNT